MPVTSLKKKTPAIKEAGKFALAYLYTSRSRSSISILDNYIYATKAAAVSAAEKLLNNRNRYYNEILILETISKVAFERVPIKVIEVE